jgi:predicted RNA-binding protein with PUA domain
LLHKLFPESIKTEKDAANIYDNLNDLLNKTIIEHESNDKENNVVTVNGEVNE